MRQMTHQDVIEALGLVPLPEEGGYYKEVYRSEERIPRSGLPGRYDGDRSFGTDIYFLIHRGEVSKFHRLRSDEIWYHHLGGPITVVELTPDGKTKKVEMGSDLERGQRLKYVFKRGSWFGASTSPGVEFALLSCAVIPGFEFADFEVGKREALLKAYPQAREEIERLT